MKIFYILMIGIVFIGFGVVVGINIFRSKGNTECLSVENFNLIKNSEIADTLSKYKISKSNNEIRFSSKDDYTLFLLKKNSGDEVELIGLDGYGLRNKEFNKFICQLIDRIQKT